MHPLHTHPIHLEKGFTAIELITTLAILSILTGLAAPSFTHLIERWRVKQTSEALQSTLTYARSEAIKRGGGITISRSTETSCTNASGNAGLWSCGWVVFADSNNNGTQDTDEEILQAITPGKDVHIQLTDAGSINLSDSILVDRWGQLTNNASANFAFRLKPEGRDNTSASAISLCISSTGRIKHQDSGVTPCT